VAEEYCWTTTGGGAVMLRQIRFQCPTVRYMPISSHTRMY